MKVEYVVPNTYHPNMYLMMESLYKTHQLEELRNLSINVLSSNYDPFEWFQDHYPEIKFNMYPDSTNSSMISKYINSIKSSPDIDNTYYVFLNDKVKFNENSFDEYLQCIQFMENYNIDIMNCKYSRQVYTKLQPVCWMYISLDDISDMSKSSGIIIKGSRLLDFNPAILSDEYIYSLLHLGVTYLTRAQALVSTRSTLKFNYDDSLPRVKEVEYTEFTSQLSDSIAVVTFDNNIVGSITGVTNAAFYLVGILSKYFTTAELVHIAADTPGNYHNIVSTSDWSYLNRYKSIIFISPGMTNEKSSTYSELFYKRICDVTVPFSFMVHGEVYTKLHPYYKLFLEHPFCKYIIYNSEGMDKLFPEYTEVVQSSVVLPISPQLEPISNIISKAKSKSVPTVVSTSRWIPRKRIYDLIEISPDLSRSGLSVQIQGSQSSTFYVKKINDELLSQGYDNYVSIGGSYTQKELSDILKDCMYHYNIVYSKRSSDIIIPRIELASLEALNAGCLPLVCTETVPRWLSELSISKDDISELPKLLSSMSAQDRINRITEFYNLVKLNIHDKYNEICLSIKELVE